VHGVSTGELLVPALSNSVGHSSQNSFLCPAGHGKSGREGLVDCRLMDLKNGTELVLTYEDKDGDWMLVGDVPWR
jgi:hypothetical protein